jgi:imidazolonepropionase
MEHVDLIVRAAGELLTMRGPDGETRGPRRGEALRHLGAIPDGALAAKDGVVVAVGTTKEIDSRFRSETVIDAKGGVVLPGFVDAHTHTVWSGSRAWELDWKVQGKSYKEITRAGGGIPFTMNQTRDADQETLTMLAMRRFLRAIRAGTTSLEAKSGYGLTHDTEITQLRAIRVACERAQLRVFPTYLGLHERPPEHKEDVSAYLEEIRGRTLPAIREEHLAGSVDAFLEEGVFLPDEVRDVLMAAKEMGFRLRLHVDEFSDVGGAAFAAELGAAAAEHLLQVSDDGIEALARSDTVATLLPLVPFAVREFRYAPARRMVDAGCIVALGSDFSPNVPSLNMLQVVHHAVYGMGLRPREALVAATVNSGYSLDPDGGLGVLAEGHPADLVVTDAPSPEHLAYAFGHDSVRMVVSDGRVMAR